MPKSKSKQQNRALGDVWPWPVIQYLDARFPTVIVSQFYFCDEALVLFVRVLLVSRKRRKSILLLGFLLEPVAATR